VDGVMGYDGREKVAQVSEPAVSPISKSAGLETL